MKESNAIKQRRHKETMQKIEDLKLNLKNMGSYFHFRAGYLDFWTTTGTYYNNKTHKRARGVVARLSNR